MKQVAENEVTVNSLTDIFHSAYMKVLDVNGKSFWLQGGCLKTQFFLDDERKYLKLSIVYGFSDGITFPEATFIANKVNEENILIKFGVFQHEGKIFVESTYYMIYEEGIISCHLIRIAQRFENFTVNALRLYYKDYI